LIQRTIVPSAIDSPICGITTSVAIFNSQLSSLNSHLSPLRLEI
jgi:hypothetical protein